MFLPQVWHEDRERCRAADIPDEIIYQPKWQIALRQLLRARAVEFTLNGLTFAEGYGSKPGFLDSLEDAGQSYVGEVPCSCACFTRPPHPDESSHRAEGDGAHA